MTPPRYAELEYNLVDLCFCCRTAVQPEQKELCLGVIVSSVLLLASFARTDWLSTATSASLDVLVDTALTFFVFFLCCCCAYWIIWCFHNPPNSDLTWPLTCICDWSTFILLITDSCKCVCCESEGPDLLLSKPFNKYTVIHAML